MEMLQLSWAKIKEIKNTFHFNLNFVDTTDCYVIWGTDGIMKFMCQITKVDSPAEGSDQKDFEDNYKNVADTNARTDGKTFIYNSPRPLDCTTYFTSAGDNGGISQGNELLYSLTAQDSEQYVDITFSEDVWFKDAQIYSDANTPFGAYLDTEIRHPQAGVVGSFGRKIFLMKDWIQPLDTEDRGLVPYGLTVRIKVVNSNGQGIKDPAAAFKVMGRLEIYRVGQV